jgi:hypothetical protein
MITIDKLISKANTPCRDLDFSYSDTFKPLDRSSRSCHAIDFVAAGRAGADQSIGGKLVGDTCLSYYDTQTKPPIFKAPYTDDKSFTVPMLHVFCVLQNH